MSKVDLRFEDKEIKVSVDLDQDGKSSLGLSVNLNEAFQEAFNKGEAIEGAKVTSFKFEEGKLIIEIDTDKDGERLCSLEVNIPETFKEGISLLKKEEVAPTAE